MQIYGELRTVRDPCRLLHVQIHKLDEPTSGESLWSVIRSPPSEVVRPLQMKSGPYETDEIARARVP